MDRYGLFGQSDKFTWAKIKRNKSPPTGISWKKKKVRAGKENKERQLNEWKCLVKAEWIKKKKTCWNVMLDFHVTEQLPEKKRVKKREKKNLKSDGSEQVQDLYNAD